MGRAAGIFHGRDQLLYQADIGLVDHLRIAMAVHGSQVDDHVTLYEIVQQPSFSK